MITARENGVNATILGSKGQWAPKNFSKNPFGMKKTKTVFFLFENSGLHYNVRPNLCNLFKR